MKKKFSISLTKTFLATTVEGFKAPARWVQILDGYKALLSLARATVMLQKASKVLCSEIQ